MTMTATYGQNESNGSIGLIRSGLHGLSAIFASLVAARERQMRHRVDSALEILDREMLAVHGYERHGRPGTLGGQLPI